MYEKVTSYRGSLLCFALNSNWADLLLLIGIQFLDSKYLLDKDGVIKDFNTRIADDQYLSLIQSVVKGTQ